MKISIVIPAKGTITRVKNKKLNLSEMMRIAQLPIGWCHEDICLAV